MIAGTLLAPAGCQRRAACASDESEKRSLTPGAEPVPRHGAHGGGPRHLRAWLPLSPSSGPSRTRRPDERNATERVVRAPDARRTPLIGRSRRPRDRIATAASARSGFAIGEQEVFVRRRVGDLHSFGRGYFGLRRVAWESPVLPSEHQRSPWWSSPCCSITRPVCSVVGERWQDWRMADQPAACRAVLWGR